MTAAPWQDAWIDMLRTMWAAGHSAADIAARLNGSFRTGFSRSAVIGKLGRLGLLGQVSKAGADKRRSAAAKRQLAAASDPGPAKPNRHSFLFARPERKPRRPPLAHAASGPAPDAAPVTIMGLDSRVCRWPEDRNEYGEQLFCGAPVGEIDPRRRYCDHHHARERSR